LEKSPQSKIRQQQAVTVSLESWPPPQQQQNVAPTVIAQTVAPQPASAAAPESSTSLVGEAHDHPKYAISIRDQSFHPDFDKSDGIDGHSAKSGTSLKL